ncbi:MAG: sodium-dependent transporter [Woeseiaceae bacterium]|nr:sodium-dependent transporter [Woeseiaceae bacterium]
MALTTSGDSDQTWSSGLTFVLAAVGAAVGLGNIWRFPYVAGESGGSAFLIVYVICVVFIAIPILIGELMIGRRGSHSPPVAMAAVAKEAGVNRRWNLVAWMGLLAGFGIASYYSVIAGWTLAYIPKALTGYGGGDAAAIAAQFDQLQAEPGKMTLWHTVFMFITMFIIGRGLHGGIERAVKILMPALFAMMILMIGYASTAGDFGAAVDFLFSADFSKIDGPIFLEAIGQAFFSIGVAMGLMMVYGAYVPKTVSLTRSAVVIAGADTLVAILAGLMIFPLVFGNGLATDSGPSLIFRTLPTAFADMPGGAIFGALFFLLLAFAAVTSLIALIEPLVAYAIDKWGITRHKACIGVGVVLWAVGLCSVLSFNEWADLFPLAMIERFETATLFDIIDFVTAQILMPLGGILIALFVGWRMKAAVLSEELPAMGAAVFQLWLWMVRIVAPLGIAAVMYNALF